MPKNGKYQNILCADGHALALSNIRKLARQSASQKTQFPTLKAT
nr:MAG TPA: hypothetical protein [Caudoviricetes sp.]